MEVYKKYFFSFLLNLFITSLNYHNHHHHNRHHHRHHRHLNNNPYHSQVFAANIHYMSWLRGKIRVSANIILFSVTYHEILFLCFLLFSCLRWYQISSGMIFACSDLAITFPLHFHDCS